MSLANYINDDILLWERLIMNIVNSDSFEKKRKGISIYSIMPGFK